MECWEPATGQYCSVNRIEVIHLWISSSGIWRNSSLLLIGPIIITGIISSIVSIALQFRLAEHKTRLMDISWPKGISALSEPGNFGLYDRTELNQP